MKNTTLLLLFLAFNSLLFAQKKIIKHEDYNLWNRLENAQISKDGGLITYELKKLKGDGKLLIYHNSNQITDTINKGKDARISANSSFVVFKIGTGYDTLRSCELNKVDKKKWPKDTLGVYLITQDSLITFPLYKSHKVSEEGDWIAMLADHNNPLNDKSEGDNKKKNKKQKKAKKGKDKKPEYTSDGKLLMLFNPLTGEKIYYNDVTEYEIYKNGTFVSFVTHQKKDSSVYTLHLLNLNNDIKSSIKSGVLTFNNLVFDANANHLAYLWSADTTENKGFSLDLLNTSSLENQTIADSALLQNNRCVSENRSPIFREDNNYLFFGVIPYPEPEKKDSLLESEKVKLDIWHYEDSRIMPNQLVELKSDQKKNDLYAYNLNTKQFVQVSNDSIEVNISAFQTGNYVLGASYKPYEATSLWNGMLPVDHYRISLDSGTVQLIKKATVFDGKLSQSGRYYSYFDENALQYFLMDLERNNARCLTCSVTDIDWQYENNGLPIVMDPYGVLGYSKNEDQLFIQGKYDVWTYDLTQNKLSNLTAGYGASNGIRLSLNKWEYDSLFIDLENCYLEGFNEKTKAAHVFLFEKVKNDFQIKEIYKTDHKLPLILKSEKGSQILFKKMSVKDYPDLLVTSNNFETETKISSTNPQQEDYNWATVESVSWKSYDGQQLEGLFYKPEDFDSTKQYPLMVYYYELNSEEIHNHSTPRPTASVIYPTEYASGGYLVFIPDIRYEVGHPAQSAYNCIMSGTDYLLKKYSCIDSTRMGLQGQSWGGYQTLQLITMTNRYAAAMAGAPVSNMFSAYGGIRWGTGVSRQFQYEMGQSRIGKTIWESPELYIENSPIFHIPKIQTPLLFMSNDNDGAVPWYQGIELFTGMKRLGKTCWMLNYNDEEHNLVGLANKTDLSIRMRQFFDHYLMGQPAPKWMTEGIPALEKGKDLGY
jgi:dipeptidyl aminopeptidase/acylaminoacyl peptidase